MSKEHQKFENGGSGLLHGTMNSLWLGLLHVRLHERYKLYYIMEHCFSPLTKICILDCIDIEVDIYHI